MAREDRFVQPGQPSTGSVCARVRQAERKCPLSSNSSNRYTAIRSSSASRLGRSNVAAAQDEAKSKRGPPIEGRARVSFFAPSRFPRPARFGLGWRQGCSSVGRNDRDGRNHQASAAGGHLPNFLSSPEFAPTDCGSAVEKICCTLIFLHSCPSLSSNCSSCAPCLSPQPLPRHSTTIPLNSSRRLRFPLPVPLLVPATNFISPPIELSQPILRADHHPFTHFRSSISASTPLHPLPSPTRSISARLVFSQPADLKSAEILCW